MIEFLKI